MNSGKTLVFTLSCALLLLTISSTTFVGAVPSADFYDDPGVRLLNQPIGEYKARRAKLMDQVKDGIVIVLGNVERDAGVEERYRQNNWMAYLTGVRTPDAAVMLVPQGLPSQDGAKEIVFIPSRNFSAERWTGVQLAPGPDAAKTFGVERVLSTSSDFWPKIKEAAALPAF
ncbi:MAG: Xaa-Pro aminopeptidase, partial [Blastocatellia bacterium]|nr:Xaa-Pro aminopeptidase [Blastocatellia bacterium]